MKKTNPAPIVPSEDDIRQLAYDLYAQSGHLPGRDLENWLEAEELLGLAASVRARAVAAAQKGRIRREKSA